MYDHKKVEEETLKFWEENRIFDKLREKNAGKEKFRFIDGPITANNPMGVHHAYSRTMKDLYQRYKALQGYDQRFQNGFDCHGLPVEVEVEKELGLSTKRDIEKYGMKEFIEKCKERVNKMIAVQTQQSIRLGQWMDWGNDYLTMSDENIEHTWMFFKKCNEKNMIYKGGRVLPWCVRCGTSLSQHELVEGYKELTHDAVFLQFPLKNRDNEYLLVWTTTPWTLTSNVACAVNPDVMYVKAQKDGKIYYLSKALAEKVLEEYEELESVSGSQMIGWEYEGSYDHLPAQKDIIHKVVDWDLVGETDGTGIVHIAPGCGAEDYDLGQQLDLPVIAPLDENGDYIEGFDWLTGKNVTKVLELILKDLQDREVLYKKDKITHRYPTCWRCKEELVFRMTDAWFLKADEVRNDLLRNAASVYWYPEHGGKLMEDWLNNLRDWNFSRNRYWGCPLPFWICENENCSHINVIGSREELEEKAVSGIKQLKDLHKPNIDSVKIKCEKCSGNATRVPHVADCWIDAGIVPYSTLHYMTDREHWEEWFPAQYIAEMREQIRLWFYSMLFISTVLENKAPYEKCYLFEKVYDEKGNEMHKSGKNVIWFDEAADKIGADVMRWMYSKTNATQNVLFGYGPAKEINNTLNYLTNIAAYVSKFIKEKPENSAASKPEDEWFLSKLEETKKKVTEELEALHISNATAILEDFFVNVFSRQYIKYIRNRTSEPDVINLMYNALLDVLKMMAPFTPFLTDYIYQEHFRKYEEAESIHLLEWPKAEESTINKELHAKFEATQQLIETTLALRNIAGIKIRQPLKKLVVITEKELAELVELIEEQVNVKEVEFADSKPEGNYASAKHADFEVFLSKDIDEALAREGRTRDLIRHVQQMRKEMKLVESDAIIVSIEPMPDVDLELFKKVTNTVEISEEAVEGNEKKLKLNEEEILIMVKKV